MYKEERLNSTIKEIASDFLEREFSAPGILLTVTRIELREHFTKAQIFVTIYPDNKEKDVLAKARTKMHLMQSFFKKRLKTKVIPYFEILLDQGEKNRERIEKILSEDSKNASSL